MGTNPLVGTWRLVSLATWSTDGAVRYPLGRDPLGYLIYTEDGYMAYQTMGGAGPPDAAQPPQSYSGPYAYRGDTVVHTILVSADPRWVGTDQVRTVALTGDALTLGSGPIAIAGTPPFRVRLIWQRARPG